jgi:hypothetical protein
MCKLNRVIDPWAHLPSFVLGIVVSSRCDFVCCVTVLLCIVDGTESDRIRSNQIRSDQSAAYVPNHGTLVRARTCVRVYVCVHISSCRRRMVRLRPRHTYANTYTRTLVLVVTCTCRQALELALASGRAS